MRGLGNFSALSQIPLPYILENVCFIKESYLNQLNALSNIFFLSLVLAIPYHTTFITFIHIVVHFNVLHLFSFPNPQSLYGRGKNYVDNCNKAEVKMDDVLPGVIIEAVLGVEIIDIPEIIDQSYRVPGTDPAWYKSKVWI